MVPMLFGIDSGQAQNYFKNAWFVTFLLPWARIYGQSVVVYKPKQTLIEKHS
jgi:hypothetical protein